MYDFEIINDAPVKNIPVHLLDVTFGQALHDKLCELCLISQVT